MTSSNGVGDGSWNLTITVGDLNTDKTLRVRGDLHIGGLMLQLVNGLGQFICLIRSTVKLMSYWIMLKSMRKRLKVDF